MANLETDITIAEQYLTVVAIALLTHAGSFKVDGYTVAISVGGAPSRFTVGQALFALALVEGGQTGSVEIGTVTISITKD